MKALKLLLLVFALFSTSCEKIDKDCPDCIKDKIKDFSQSSLCNDASAAQYLFQGEYIYVLSEGSCGVDRCAQVYSENCELLGTLGGIAGNMRIDGVVFNEVAIFQKEVWHY
jgi:hypothetical protein